jgi:hypothetical protein
MPTNPKPTLAIEHLPVFRVHYLELEDYIKVVFGFDFDVLSINKVSIGMTIEYRVPGNWPITLERTVGELREGRRCTDLPLILNVLAHDEYIPKGLYSVSTKAEPIPIDVYRALLQQSGDVLNPRCVALRDKHRNDKDFSAKALILEKALQEALKGSK